MKEGRPDARHQALRESLGPLVLGHLDGEEEATLRAHLDGCPECRAELADIAPLVQRLDTVDPDRLPHLPSPPPGLGAQIHRAVAEERARHSSGPSATHGPRHSAAGRATARRTPVGPGWLLGAAAALVVVALVGGLLLGRATAPQPEPPAAVPLEPISLTIEPTADGVTVEEAGLVPHTWGVELRFVGAGFDEGATFRAAFRLAGSDELVPAGEFRGTGAAEMSCNLQSAVLRDDVSEVVVTNEAGDTVLSASL